MARVLSGVPDAHVEVVIGLDVLTGSPDCIAEVRGHGYITGEHARELIGPGTTLHRLVTDPLDGRCIERSTTAYRPDRAMLDQLRAADATCREPGCTTPWWRCQPDHEHPYDAGGATAETNLDYKDGPVHWLKTAQLWRTTLEALTRKVTWWTLFGRCYTTKPYDYRAHLPEAAHPDERTMEAQPRAASEQSDRLGSARREHSRREMLRQGGFTVMTYDAVLTRLLAHALTTLSRDADGHPVVTVSPGADIPGEVRTGSVSGRAASIGPAPVTADPAPVTADPAPVTADPAPVTADPAPVTADPAPVTADPAPVTVDLAQLLYAALAEHAPAAFEAEFTDAEWALPVDNAHKHGNQTRRGTPPTYPRYADLLDTRPAGPLESAASAQGHPASRDRAPRDPARRDPAPRDRAIEDEPPPF